MVRLSERDRDRAERMAHAVRYRRWDDFNDLEAEAFREFGGVRNTLVAFALALNGSRGVS